MTRRAPLLAAAVLLATTAAAARQPYDVVTWSAKARAHRQPGLVEVDLFARIQDGWYIYALSQPDGGPVAMRVNLETPAFTFDSVRALQPPQREHDPNFGIRTDKHRGSPAFLVRIRARADTAPGSYDVPLRIRYQACSAEVCLPPQTIDVPVSVRVSRVSAAREPAARTPEAVPVPSEPSGAAQLDPASGSPAPAVPSASADVERAGRFNFLWLACAGGLLAVLTPCVFPLLPTTVAMFGDQSSRARAMMDALWFTGAITGTFGSVGLIVTLAGGAGLVTQLAAHPATHLAFAALFLMFALLLLGSIHLQAPGALILRLDAAARGARHRAMRAGMMGTAFALASLSCTAPVAGSLLAAASLGDPLTPILGMLAFSAGFSAPFVALALAPSALRRLPRGGPWLMHVKVLLALFEIAAAIKFAANADAVSGWGILTRDVVLAGWIAAALLAAVYLWDQSRSGGPAPKPGLLLGSLAAGALALSLVPGLAGAGVGELEAYLPPESRGRIAGRPERAEAVFDNLDAATAHAAAVGKPVFVEFTGYTCTNCRWMEKNMFPRPSIRAGLDKYVHARLFTDGVDEHSRRNLDLQLRLTQSIALPTYLLLSPDAGILGRFQGMTRDETRFLAFLDGPGSVR